MKTNSLNTVICATLCSLNHYFWLPLPIKHRTLLHSSLVLKKALNPQDLRDSNTNDKETFNNRPEHDPPPITQSNYVTNRKKKSNRNINKTKESVFIFTKRTQKPRKAEYQPRTQTKSYILFRWWVSLALKLCKSTFAALTKLFNRSTL